MRSFEVISDDFQQLINNDNYREARHLLEENLISDDTLPREKSTLLYHIGRFDYFENNYKEAKKYFIKALEFDSDNFYAKFYLARILDLMDDKLAALKLYIDCLADRKDFFQLIDFVIDTSNKVDYCNKEISGLLISTKQKAVISTEKGKFPKISVILLCYNKLDYTERCLKSIFKNTKYPYYDVIVVDNASIDDTPAYMETFGKSIKYIRNKTNVGFIGGNNIGVAGSDAEYVIFLNNDTEVMENWLLELYKTFLMYPDAGAIGSRLIYPDGKLQEAGGAVFSDALGWNYGKFGSINDSRYGFVREVDYCSGAALMVKRELFNKVGGYDEYFAPAYYEDSDLCFAIRKLGYKTYFCPYSSVIHYEGITNSTDTNIGLKKYQVTNRPKFQKKWAKELKLQYPNNPDLKYFFSNRKRGKHVLFIDDIPPLPDRAAGARMNYYTLLQMLKLGYRVTYIYCMGKQYKDEAGIKCLDELRHKGVELIWFNYESWWTIRNMPEGKSIVKKLIDSLELGIRKFDIVYIAFWHIAKNYIDLIRNKIPNTPIIIDSVDVHYLREKRQAAIENNPKLLRKAKETQKAELEVYSKVDCVTTVTDDDREELRKQLPNKPIFVFRDVHDVVELKTKFEDHRDLLFVGNFNHLPNRDAIFYFVEKIFPRIKSKLKDIKLYIVGNNPTKEIEALKNKNIIVTGWVPSIEPYYKQCRVNIVPLRYGAGHKGKIGESFAHGLPVVTTPIGIEGLGVTNGEEAFVADSPEKFVEYITRLYSDKDIWNKFVRKGKELVTRRYSSASMRRRIQYFMSYKTRAAFRSYRALRYPYPPEVSIIIVAKNSWQSTKKCIDSIKNNVIVNHEIIVIDNASTDETQKILRKEHPEVRVMVNKSEVAFPNAVNQGLNVFLGTYVLILSNEVIVTQGLLERMIKAAQSDSSFGIVLPLLNNKCDAQLEKDVAQKEDFKLKAGFIEINSITYNKTISSSPASLICTLIKKNVIEKIGGLDERFSNGYFVNEDFYLRTKIGGYKTVIAQNIFLTVPDLHRCKSDEKNYHKLITNGNNTFTDKWGYCPDEIWQNYKQKNQRQIKYPINEDIFIQNYERSLIQVEEKDFHLANDSLKQAILSYHVSDRKDYCIEYPDILNLAGNIALIVKNFESAKKYFEEELQSVKDSPRAHVGLADMFAALKNYKLSKEKYGQALQYDPGNEEAKIKIKELNDGILISSNGLDNNKTVSIIILTYNALDYTKQCLESIKQHTQYPHEIIFVDNHSTDGTKKYLRNLVQQHPNYKLIVNKTNKGFAAGNNQGMNLAKGEYILLLNNDILVSDGWLERMVACVEADSGIGLVGPLTNRISGLQMVANVPYSDPQDFPEYAAKIAKQYNNKYTPRRRIAGFAMLIKRDVYENIGGLDEQFGSGNYEDDDYCLRAKKAGFNIMVAEDVFIHHYGSMSFKNNKIDYDKSLKRNDELFRKKWPNINLNWLLEKKKRLTETNVALMEKAEKQLKSRNTADALKFFNSVLETDPINQDVLFGLALCARQKNDSETALKHLKKLLKLNPDHAGAYNLSGIISFESGDLESAKKLFITAIEKDPKLIEAQRNFGEVLFVLGDYDNCVNTFMAILKNHPNDVPTLLNVSHLYLEVGKNSEAIAYLEKARHLEPDNRKVIDMLKSVSEGKENIQDNSKREMQSDQIETTEEFRLSRAFSLLTKGEIETAQEMYTEVLTEDSKSESALFGLALCARQQQDNESALRYLNKLIKINPNCADAYNQSGLISFETGDLESSKTLFAAAIEKDPKLIEAQRNYGEVLLALDDYESGVKTFVAILDKHPDDVPSLIRMAQLYNEVGKDKEARQYAAKVLEYDSDNSLAKKILKL